MATVQLPSDVLTASLDAPRAAVVAVRLSELMGLYRRSPGERIDRNTVAAVLTQTAAHGLAEEVAAGVGTRTPDDGAVFDLLHALRESPLPAPEIGALGAILGPSTLGRMVGISDASLRRYASSSRETPDDVAQRIHFLALIVAIVRGSFNEFGVRRWFERPHPRLSGATPAARLGSDFDPDDEAATDVLGAAAALLG